MERKQCPKTRGVDAGRDGALSPKQGIIGNIAPVSLLFFFLEKRFKNQ